MKLTKDEIIKKLAKAVLDNRLVCGDASGECFVCEQLAGTHKPDCPVLLAEEVLTKESSDNDCFICNGAGHLNDICHACNGTGVKK